jgi:TorA maturation chaperone TorD
MNRPASEEMNSQPNAMPTSGLTEEQARRVGLYSVLAALLRQAPDQHVLDYLGQLGDAQETQDNELLLSLSMLALSAQHSEPTALQQEYHDLFIGLGRGELVPYGSWYQTGFLHERPLSQLRDHLAQLGFARADDVHEPEDHIAALLEVMAMLIQENQAIAQQQAFFSEHIEPWAERFLDDLATAPSAVFYKAVARLAQAYLQIEVRYLTLFSGSC